VGVLGSVSMPIGSSDDSMVKVASETVSSPKFYERFFTLVELFLPPEAKKAAHIKDKPKPDLGVPEAKAAPAPLAPSAAEAAPAPAEAAPAASEPVAPPPEAAPIAPTESAEPASTTETVTPPPQSSLPPPTEPISAIPVSGQ
jgi:hypothetical protein